MRAVVGCPGGASRLGAAVAEVLVGGWPWNEEGSREREELAAGQVSAAPRWMVTVAVAAAYLCIKP
jgi:hypothetical protein